MKVVIDGPSVAGHARMRVAALGLALRGHEVAWKGRGSDDAIREVPGVLRVGATGAPLGSGAEPRPPAPFRADVVLGAGRPRSTAWRGWLTGAGSMVQAVDPATLARWDAVDRWAWGSLTDFALIEAGDAEIIRARPGPLTLERVGLWSDDPPAARPAAEHPDCEILERACERVLARHRSAAPRRAVFLDRDGTLIEEVGYLSDPEHVRLLPGVPAALARLKAAGFALVVISNQAGVGRGLFPLERVHAAMARMRRLLRAEGVELDAVYFCPHRPEDACACRKPGVELLERAGEDLHLVGRGSAMIGDKAIDVEAGQRAGVLGILVGTGYGAEEGLRIAGEGGVRPDRVCADLGEAASWLIETTGGGTPA